MAHHVVYIPGLGDQKAYGQDIILKAWRLLGLDVHYFALGWADDEPFESKLSRLLSEIDGLQGQGDAVSLIGVSAGASAAINAYARRKQLNGVVLVCGKTQNPQTVARRYYRENPAFEQSLAGVSASLNSLAAEERRRLMSIHPIWDNTVPIADTIIEGAVEKTIPVIGHIPGIFYSIIFAAPAIAKFIKKLPRLA